jgi:hypothetical protein
MRSEGRIVQKLNKHFGRFAKDILLLIELIIVRDRWRKTESAEQSKTPRPISAIAIQ